jgi:hypothetical protein
MPSDIGRGIKFGIGFALGVGFILTLFLFGLSMCAGRLHQHMMERMEEMMPRERRPVPETQDGPVALQPYALDPRTYVDDEMVFRSYACPSCGLLIQTELARPADEPLWDIQLAG